ncbi:hypothetical protein [Epilithonimonas mollis]|uniref:Uncharacterized protein n=1 Tax=Epilithonimonas mollis TaxID=216903 RepID=A0A1M6UQ14_9FLAO|nr:hypothetical protein [Epilithonimonas mollis]SHK71253.1 hypothetical protein SAMN05444371_3409 [Epilithonimonas mollis]
MKARNLFAEASGSPITDTQKDFFPQGQRNTFAIENETASQA